MFINVHTHHPTNSKEIFEIQNKYPTAVDFSTPFSIGIHPWFLKKETLEIELILLEEKLQNPNCFAIGECGLDKAIDVDLGFQKEVFIKQIHLSEKYQKPMIIHCVRAFQEIIELKKQFSPIQNWMLHGFQKSKQLAESLVFNGIFLSFGEALLSKSDVQNVILDFPLDNFLIETDNSEVSIALIYQKIAAIKNIEIEVLKEKVQANFNTIFKK